MKKTLIGLLVLVMIGGFVALVQAAPSANVTVRVTITSILDIYMVSGSTITFASPMDPGAGASIAGTATVIRNNGGGIAQTYKMYATSPAGWTAGVTASTDTYVLQALFNGSLPTSGNFGSEDTLGEDVGGEITADSSTILTIDGSYKGASVPYPEERSIWYQFQPPSISTLDGTLDITVTIVAIKS